MKALKKIRSILFSGNPLNMRMDMMTERERSDVKAVLRELQQDAFDKGRHTAAHEWHNGDFKPDCPPCVAEQQAADELRAADMDWEGGAPRHGTS